ncbi:hypothetical protein [Nocardia mexicana]|uniref:Cbb3-type cytochrome c oxidase subunit 3 n=1 Tax=Nocardia mexicana TaxID=279262 RepID=A0A370GFC2_9NOCA|nr:hypothetical protein [Nocardia mexicana]RDI42512.1 hypothetical protein DFR68_12650 [Nocardia mexicana]
MSWFGWQVGLLLVIGIPLGVLIIAVYWPQRPPKDRSVRAIRDRIDDEDAEGD